MQGTDGLDNRVHAPAHISPIPTNSVSIAGAHFSAVYGGKAAQAADCIHKMCTSNYKKCLIICSGR